MTPWMTENEINLLTSYLRPDHNMLEWGSGGSTTTFPSYLSNYFSIESDKNYYNELKIQLPKNVNYKLIEPDVIMPQGPRTVSWVLNYKPLDDPYNTLKLSIKDVAEFPLRRLIMFKSYVLGAAAFGESVFNNILVDGRARVGCCLYAIKLMDKRSILFIHDFFRRDEYHDVYKYLKEINRVDQLAVFKKDKECPFL